MKAPLGESSIRGVKLVALLLVMVGASIAIHGYHYGIEDEAIYLPAIKAHLNSALYPHDAMFFSPQTKPTLFDNLVAASARVIHAPVDYTVFVYYLGTLLLFYAGLWAVAGRMFPGTKGKLGGMLLVGALLTLPVAGTGLYIVDQHLHPRTLATALILLAATQLIPKSWGEQITAREYAWVVVLMTGAALIHIQMTFYGAIFLGVLMLPLKTAGRKAVMLAGGIPAVIGSMVARGGPEWQEASRTRTSHYLMRWEWYEWVGAIAPIFVLWGMAWLARRRGLPVAASVAVRTALFAALGLVAGCVIAIPRQMERWTPYQPLRMLHLTYIVMMLLMGGLLAEVVLKQKVWRWALLLLPIAASMSLAQLELFPDSRHVEWPGCGTGNDWVEAFNWVKANTPVDAYFVLNPHYMRLDGEDYHGFRGLAERSQMADWEKDPGVALLFPALAPRWSHEVHALDGWNRFTAADFHRLHEQFGVGWTVLPYRRSRGLMGEHVTVAETAALDDCPYHNLSVVVCRIK